jgi:hypothetical protein
VRWCLALLVLWVGLTSGMPAPLMAGEHEYIRLVQEHDVWWFQDSAGHKFFSLGVNCLGGCFGHREDAAIAPDRKQRIMALLQSWGFNTAGAWSSPSLWDALYVTDQIYPEFQPTRHDVFDESFWHGSMAAHLRREVQPFVGQKHFLGYFLDNEPEWPAEEIFAWYLRLPQDVPGSRAFVGFLRQYYQGNLNQLNTEWGTAYVSFDRIPGSDLRRPYPISMQRGVVTAWRTEVAITFYRRYAALVRALDPQHLILGIRYRSIPERELFTALSPYFDVNSINDYTRYGRLKPVYAELYEATGKPLMITEFSFSGFPQPGQPSFLFVDVYTQEHRGLGYQQYVQQAARAPFMVGMHWFMWMDYPSQVGEPGTYPPPPDENVGLVTSDEAVVYEELGRWISQANAAVPALHEEAHWQPPPAPEPQRLVLARFVPRVDGELAEWPPALAIRPTSSLALRDDTRVDQTYFLAWDEQALYLAGDIDDPHLVPPPPEHPWQGDSLTIRLAPTGRPNPSLEGAVTIVIYPTGGGPDQQQPFAAMATDPKRQQPLPLQIARQSRPGRYTLEARIPASALAGLQLLPGTTWRLTLRYQNVDGLYQSRWEGLVTPAP